MILLFDTNLPSNKTICIALTKIYGINKNISAFLCKKLGYSDNLKVHELSHDQLLSLKKEIENSNILITNRLKKLRHDTLKNNVKKKLYKGLRRLKGLPVRGQRTHTNAKTSRKIK